MKQVIEILGDERNVSLVIIHDINVLEINNLQGRKYVIVYLKIQRQLPVSSSFPW